jgi:hypothetical protein
VFGRRPLTAGSRIGAVPLINIHPRQGTGRINIGPALTNGISRHLAARSADERNGLSSGIGAGELG